MIHHHLRRLRRHGQLAALAPASEGLWAQTAVAAARGQRARGADRRRERAARDGRGDPRRAAPRPRLLVEPPARLRPRPAQVDPGPGPAGRDRRARSRSGCSSGRARRSPSSSRAAASSRPRASSSCAGTKIQCELDAHGRMMHCHHEKLVIVDDEIAFVGGIDLTALAGDRYDSNAHPHKPDAIGWHDASSRLRGPIVRDVAAHFALRWEAVRGEALELPEAIAPAGDTTVQFTRTVPEGAYDVLPRGEFSILESYVRALRSARHLIYLENQFLWSPEIVDDPRGASCATRRATTSASSSCCRTRPTTARTTRAACSAAWSPPTRARKRFLAATILSRTGERSGPLYVHAKIGIVDDALARDRLREPQRALALQRLRGRRRHLRPGARPRHPPAAVGGAPRAADADGDPAQRDRRAVAPDRERAARAPPRRSATDPSPRRAARGQPPFPAAAGPARRARRRRLASRHRLLRVDVAVPVDRRPARSRSGCGARR